MWSAAAEKAAILSQAKNTDEGDPNIEIDQLGNDYEIFEEKMNMILGGMYQTVVNDVLKKAFIEFHAATLLKLAYKMKGGKAVSLKDIKKMDPDMAVSVEKFIYEDEIFEQKTKMLRDMLDDYSIFYGIAQENAVEDSYIRWVLFTIPEKNVVAFSILPRWKQGGQTEENTNYPHKTYFFRIIMEKGTPADKVEDKVKEIDQSLVNLNFIKDPCYKDKRDLKHSPYQYAIRKLPYLRILRKSFVGVADNPDVKEWQKQVKEIMKNAALK